MEEEEEETVTDEEDEEDGSGVKLGDLVRMVKDAEQSECTVGCLQRAGNSWMRGRRNVFTQRFRAGISLAL